MVWNKLLVVVVVAVGAAGCGGSYCDRSSPCKNDTQPTPAERDTCRAAQTANQGSACFGEVNSYTSCYLDNIVCGGDGKIDGTLTGTKVTNNCSTQYTNGVACCTKNPTATACK